MFSKKLSVFSSRYITVVFYLLFIDNFSQVRLLFSAGQIFGILSLSLPGYVLLIRVSTLVLSLIPKNGKIIKSIRCSMKTNSAMVDRAQHCFASYVRKTENSASSEHNAHNNNQIYGVGQWLKTKRFNTDVWTIAFAAKPI